MTSGTQTGDVSSQTVIPSSSSSQSTSLTTSTAPEDTTTSNVYCGDINDFEPCRTSGYNCAFGRCYCKGKEPFCRCNNFNNEWFLGNDCSQKWSLVQFALVASLPGLGLAVIVGVIVYLVHFFRKPKGHADVESPKTARQTPSTSFGHSRPGNMYANPVFASDVANNRRSESPKTAQEDISMMSRPFSYSSQPSATSQTYNNPYAKVTRNPYEEANGFSDNRRSTQNGITRGFQQASLSSPSYSAPDYDTRSQLPRAQMGRHY